MADNRFVVFTPSGKRGSFPNGTAVLDAARALGVDLDSVCGGRGLCGRCQILASEGEFAKHGITSTTANLTDVGETERKYADRRGLKPKHRLGCQACIQGDLVIDVPPESQVHKQVVRKRAEARPITLDPVVHLHTVDVTEPDMHDPTGDWQRVRVALEDQWDLAIDGVDNSVLHRLQKTLRDGDWTVTVAVRQGHHAVGIYPGYHARALGIAVDVGSTTIAGHLCDLTTGDVLASVGRMNPQIRFGEDLMSRVSYIMMHPGAENELTDTVREAVENLATEAVKEAAKKAEVAVADIHEVTVVGNPVMHHLFLGLDPTELGGAPFALATDAAITTRADELGWSFNSGARVYTLPCIAGHVGADTAAVILSEAPHTMDAMTLIVDVGTNAEIVLGNKERLLAASSPTGPAFEGAQISCGQRAAPGAIERVRIDRETLEPRFKVIGCDLWSDEDGFAEAVAGIGINGVCGSGIIEVIAEMYLAGIIDQDGAFNGTMTRTSARVQETGRSFSYLLHAGEPELRIYQTDVRAIQLAKAALYAGARLLMDRMGVDRVDRIVLAGAFGSQIDVTYAMVLGMIPDCDLVHVSSAGNAAGTGARIALLNNDARREIEDLVRRVEKIETAVEPNFQDHFVAAMAVPHKTAPYPNLANAVDLPARSQPASDSPGRRRRRKRG